MKGWRVRHKQLVDSEGYYWYGTITHYDRQHNLVYVLWDPPAGSRFAIAAPFPRTYLVRVKDPETGEWAKVWQHDPNSGRRHYV